MLVSRLRDDDGPVYKVETAFFFWVGTYLVIEWTVWVWKDSLLDRWLGARAR